MKVFFFFPVSPTVVATPKSSILSPSLLSDLQGLSLSASSTPAIQVCPYLFSFMHVHLYFLLFSPVGWKSCFSGAGKLWGRVRGLRKIAKKANLCSSCSTHTLSMLCLISLFAEFELDWNWFFFFFLFGLICFTPHKIKQTRKQTHLPPPPPLLSFFCKSIWKGVGWETSFFPNRQNCVLYFLYLRPTWAVKISEDHTV